MKPLLEIHRKQIQGAVATGLGDTGHRFSLLGLLQPAAGPLQSHAADPLGGTAAEPLQEGVLERAARVVAPGLQLVQAQGFMEVFLEIGDQLLEAVATFAPSGAQPVQGIALPQLRHHQCCQQAVDQQIQLKTLKQGLALLAQLAGHGQHLPQAGEQCLAGAAVVGLPGPSGFEAFPPALGEGTLLSHGHRYPLQPFSLQVEHHQAAAAALTAPCRP